ncbi:MAG TPA: glycosyltransferase family 2 protein [Candidatus Caccenecus avistercoris]|nr:glycosyltransferase family 2 protein [Candidatus Caccenecus avistercoris]
MKLISFVVPCYNSSSYMHHALDTILEIKEDIELIIVNDGSTDDTLKIAKEYQKKYPQVIKVIDKENGGHGSGVNAGLGIASGKYFKVVDSDDWVDTSSLKKVVATLKKQDIDMLIVNYVYEKEGSPKEMGYLNVFKENEIFTWQEVGHFKVSEYLLMHSVFYKTSLLKEIHLTLPEHTFYVDNIFVYYPLPFVKTMYYLNVPLYRYFIGRTDQSVNERVMIGRVDEQIKVTKMMIDFFDPLTIEPKSLQKYLIHYLDIMMTISTILLKLANTKEANLKSKELWNYLKEKNKSVYKKLKIARLAKLPRFISVPGYKIARKIFKFN